MGGGEAHVSSLFFILEDIEDADDNAVDIDLDCRLCAHQSDCQA